MNRSPYEEILTELAPGVNPVGVECAMRLQYGTLDHLSREEFAREADLARRCEEAEPGFLRQTARSYGLLEAFDAHEQRAAH